MKKRFSEEQIIAFLKEADARIPIKDLCRRHGFSDASYYLWRSKLLFTSTPSESQVGDEEVEFFVTTGGVHVSSGIGEEADDVWFSEVISIRHSPDLTVRPARSSRLLGRVTDANQASRNSAFSQSSEDAWRVIGTALKRYIEVGISCPFLSTDPVDKGLNGCLSTREKCRIQRAFSELAEKHPARTLTFFPVSESLVSDRPTACLNCCARYQMICTTSQSL